MLSPAAAQTSVRKSSPKRPTLGHPVSHQTVLTHILVTLGGLRGDPGWIRGVREPAESPDLLGHILGRAERP